MIRAIKVNSALWSLLVGICCVKKVCHRDMPRHHLVYTGGTTHKPMIWETSHTRDDFGLFILYAISQPTACVRQVRVNLSMKPLRIRHLHGTLRRIILYSVCQASCRVKGVTNLAPGTIEPFMVQPYSQYRRRKNAA